MGNCNGGAEAKRNKQQLATAIKELEEMGNEKAKLEHNLAKVAVELRQKSDSADANTLEELAAAKRQNHMLQNDMAELEKELQASQCASKTDLQKLESRYQDAESSRQASLERERESVVFGDTLRSRIAELQSELEYVKRCSRDDASILQQKLERASVSVGEVDRLQEELGEAKRGRDDRKRELEEKIVAMMEESERNQSAIARLQRSLDESTFNSERESSMHRQSLSEREDEIRRLETIVNDLEIALRETQDAEVDSRVAPMYDRLQRCLDQISGREEQPNTQVRDSKNQLDMLKQSHVALQQLKDALEDERRRSLEMKEALDQEKNRSQLLLKVIRHFKKKLLLAPSYDSVPHVEHEHILEQVEAY